MSPRPPAERIFSSHGDCSPLPRRSYRYGDSGVNQNDTELTLLLLFIQLLRQMGQ